jgi:hypothetical protein
MFERQNHINTIIERLTFVKTKVELSNPLNLTDVNIISENFYRDLLNLIYGYSLININITEPNASSIDLGDEGNRIAIQVTSTSNITKTRKTVASFITKGLYEKYDRLLILNIASKSTHQERHLGESEKYQLDTKEDIWDIADIIKDINNITGVEGIKKISKFLTAEIKLNIDYALAKEITTFISLITYLSDEEQPSAGNGFLEAPDPDGKINRRFADHSAFLITQYQDLVTEYGQVLKDVIDHSDIGHTRIRRLGLYLKQTSDSVLTECDGDVVLALSALVKQYSVPLSQSGAEYDESAIRFFLVDQLIKCNVFPNKILANG